MEKKHRRPLWLLPLIPAAVLLILLLTLGIPALQRAMDPFGGRLAENVSVCGLELGGMTKAEAEKLLRERFQVMSLSFPGKTLQLTPEESGLKLDTKALVNQAYQIGRNQDAPTELTLASYLRLDETAIRGLLEATAQELSQGYIPSAYFLQGEVPELSEEKFQPGITPLPTLVVQTGVPAYALDLEAAWEKLLKCAGNGEFEMDLTETATALESEAPDADGILEAVNIPAEDARMDLEALVSVPGSYGMEFSRWELERQLEKAQPGSEIRIEARIVTPAVLGREVYFQDVLGFCQTPHSDNKQRCENLRLACKALNGVVLEPGETLSYNATLGPRTQEAGYQNAPAYSGTRLIDTLGGGICQVSSTLYLCSLYAELETVERVAHGYPSTYMPVGLDATVSWGSPDLKIRNSSPLPVKIIAEDRDGFVRVWIMGTETRDYYVRMAYTGSSDRYAKSYVCKYDRLTHELISKEDHLYSAYLEKDVSAKGEIGSEEAYINGNVQEMPPCQPTRRALQESLDYRQPNTRG